MRVDQGVTIGFREIYDTVLEVKSTVERLDERVERLEKQSQDSENLEEISHTALQTAQTALDLAKETRANQTWLWRTIISALIAGAIGALFILARGGLL
jgi:hypothetical protein